MRKIIVLLLAIFLLVPVDICVAAYGEPDANNSAAESKICICDETLCPETPEDNTLGAGDEFVVGIIVYKVIECDRINKVFKVQVGTGEKGSGVTHGNKPLPLNLCIPSTVFYNGDKYDVVSISKGAFYSMQFFLIDTGDNVETIESEAFKHCEHICTLNLGKKVKNIEDHAFEGCFRIRSLYVGRNIEKIGNSAFKHCQLLRIVDIDGNLSQLGKRAFEGCRNLKDVKLGLATDTIEKETFHNCNTLEKIVLKGQLVTIEERAFKNCYMVREIQFDEGLKSIGAYAFENCFSLEKAEIPRSCIDIGEGVFRCCNNLENIVLNDGIKHIGNNAFEYCVKLVSIRIPYSVEHIGDRAFKNCELLATIEVDINNLNYSSDNGVLFNKNQTTLIRFPEGSFLMEYIVPDTVSVIAKESCINCNLNSIRIGGEVKIIEESAFCNSDIKIIGLGEGLERIERRVFANSPYLEAVVIPKSVRYIGDEAFLSYFGSASICIMGKKDESEFEDGVGKRWNGGSSVKYINS